MIFTLFSQTNATISTSRQGAFGQKVRLKVNTKKTEVMTLNVASPAPIKVGGQDFLYTETFAYMYLGQRN